MDRELIEKVTRLVIEVLDEKDDKEPVLNKETVKIWPHASPLPSPLIVTAVETEHFQEKNKKVSIIPYVEIN